MSTATSVGVFGNQLGVALGFVIPAAVVKDQERKPLKNILEDQYCSLERRIHEVTMVPTGPPVEIQGPGEPLEQGRF